MHIEAEPVPVLIEERGTLAADSLRDEERRKGGVIGQHRRVELQELQICNRRSGADRSRDAVGRRGGRVRRVRVERARSACREDHGIRRQIRDPAVLQLADAARHPSLDEEVHHKGVLGHLDRGRPHGRDQSGGDRRAGRVAAGMHDARVAVCGLLAQQERAVSGTIEGGAAGDELGDACRSIRHEHVDRRGVGEAGAGGQRVVSVQRRRVAGAVHPGDPALRERGAAAADGVLRDHAHTVPCGARMQRGGQPGDAAADDKHIHQFVAGGLAASIRSSATRAGSATSALTVMRLGVRPATSSSSTQAR